MSVVVRVAAAIEVMAVAAMVAKAAASAAATDLAVVVTVVEGGCGIMASVDGSGSSVRGDVGNLVETTTTPPLAALSAQ